MTLNIKYFTLGGMHTRRPYSFTRPLFHVQGWNTAIVSSWWVEYSMFFLPFYLIELNTVLISYCFILVSWIQHFFLTVWVLNTEYSSFCFTVFEYNILPLILLSSLNPSALLSYSVESNSIISPFPDRDEYENNTIMKKYT